MTAEAAVLQHRQPRQQQRAGLALVARQRQRALEDVARRQHAELVAQLTGRAAGVEHRHDRVQIDPRVVLQPAEQAGQSRAATEAPDSQDAHPHAGILLAEPLE